MTILLERKEKRNLFLIRLTLLIVVTVLMFLLLKEMNDYLIFFIIIFLPLFFISVSELQVFSNSIFIKKYYFFGIVPVEYKIFNGDKIKITAIDTSVNYNDNEMGTVDIESDKYRIKYIDVSGKSKDFTCKLKENEIKIIKEILGIDGQAKET